MKKRFLSTALALSLFAHFASAEGIAPHAWDGAAAVRGGREGFSGPSAERLHSSDLGEAAGLLLGLLAIASNTTFFSLSFPIPFQWANFGAGDYGQDSGWAWGWGLGLDATFIFTPRAGVHFSSDVYFPVASLGKGGSTSYQGALYSFFLGPSFPLGITEHFLLAVSPGVHFAAVDSTNAPYPAWRLLFGLGASVELDIILSSLFFIRAGVDVTYDFLGVELLKGYGNSGRNRFKVFNIMPSVGIGIWI